MPGNASRWPRDGPKMAPRTPRSPKMVQEAPRWFQKAILAPRWLQDASKMASRWSQKRSKMGPSAANRQKHKILKICTPSRRDARFQGPKGSKMAQNASRWPRDGRGGPKKPQDGPKKPQDGPKRPQGGPKVAPWWPQGCRLTTGLAQLGGS